MTDDNPMISFRMTFRSAMYVFKSKDAVLRAMDAIDSGCPREAFMILHELIMLPGIEEIEDGVMTLSDETKEWDAVSRE